MITSPTSDAQGTLSEQGTMQDKADAMMTKLQQHPFNAKIVERIQESPDIFTLRLTFSDPELQQAYSFAPGQFNMLYLYGVGEVPISIVSAPEHPNYFDHTIRAVGRITQAMAQLKAGDYIGVRGPFGRGWPLDDAKDKDLVLITGGLGCAPLVSVIHYALNRRQLYKRLVIMQGVKHSNDLIWRQQYQQWAAREDIQILLAADKTGAHWPWAKGYVTNLISQAEFDSDNCIALLCGPEVMMQTAAKQLLQRQVPEQQIWLSMERNMKCAVGHCGHCQYGAHFVCKQGPVFNYPEIKQLLSQAGF